MMDKTRTRSLITLTILIAALALAAALTGILSNWSGGVQHFTSLHGEVIALYSRGIYSNDSVASAAQAIAQDWVTLVMGIPLLVISAVLAVKGSLRAKLLCTGTLAYFLYTYTSYTFLCSYNLLFLVYVALMSMSFFAFTLMMMSFDSEKLAKSFGKKLPVRAIGGFLIVFACLVGLMWVGRIIPPLAAGKWPTVLEHYTTLVIQAMDLGFVIPVSILAAVLLLKRKAFGLLLSCVMYMKGATMLTSLTAMIVSQLLAGVKMSPIEIAVFPIANALVIIGVFIFMKNIKETQTI